MERITQLIKENYSLFNIDKCSKLPIDTNNPRMEGGYYGITGWQRKTNEELKTYHNYKLLEWGMRLGLQENGKRIMSLDFDMCGEAVNGVRVGCKKTKEFFEEYKKRVGSEDGMYTSSTKGNMNVLIDYTKSKRIIDHIEALNGSFKTVRENLEILLQGNQVIPPSTTKCKISGQFDNTRQFLNENNFYIIESDEEEIVNYILDMFNYKQSNTPPPIKLVRINGNQNEEKEEEQVTDIETEEEEQEQVNEITEADIEKYRKYAENDLFKSEYKQGQHQPWIKMATALKALLGETEGLKEWKKDTLKYRGSVKAEECNTLFKYQDISRMTKPMGYLVNIAKKNNPELVKELNKKIKKIETKKTEKEDNSLTDYQKTRIVTDDNTASIKILEDLVSQNLIKYSKGQIFYKLENIWTCNIKQTTNLLIDFVLKSELLIWSDFKGKYQDFAKNLKSAKNVTECVLIKCLTNEGVIDDSFLLKLHTSTVGKVVFNNGVLDFPTKHFYPYTTEKEEEQAFLQNIYSCIKINRDYNPIKNEKAYQDISKNIFTNIFDDQKDKMLQFLSRAFAGYFVDKDWAMFRGNRNCGKGVLNELLKATFGEYTKTIPSEYFMCERMTSGGDQAKKNSWLLDLQFTRLAVTQEINYDKADKGVKLNGIVIKGFTSGGDPKYARKNFQDEVEFYIDCKLLMCGNDFPVCNPQDTTETLIEFSSYKQFKQEKWIVEREATLKEQVANGADENILKELEIYCKADDQIKLKCNMIEWCDALIHILLDNFSKEKVEIPQKDSEEEEGESLIQKILQDFTITKNPKDKITNKKIKEIYGENEYKDSYKKFRENILGLGAKEYRNESERGIKGIVYNENQ
jgi:hypothetical protein